MIKKLRGSDLEQVKLDQEGHNLFEMASRKGYESKGAKSMLNRGQSKA